MDVGLGDARVDGRGRTRSLSTLEGVYSPWYQSVRTYIVAIARRRIETSACTCNRGGLVFKAHRLVSGFGYRRLLYKYHDFRKWQLLIEAIVAIARSRIETSACTCTRKASLCSEAVF